MMAKARDLYFPVLTIAANGFLAAIPDAESLETCGMSALRDGYFDQLVLVDAVGRSYSVVTAKKISSVGFLGGWRLFKSRRIRIDIVLEEIGTLELPALKQRICRAIEAFPGQWEAHEEPSDVKERVLEAPDIPTLIAMFLGQA